MPNSQYGIVNVTGDGVSGTVKLPYNNPDGTAVYLGDEGLGYPPTLYPNFTYSRGPNNQSQAFFGGTLLQPNSTVFIGPFTTNATFSLFSVTIPINNNTSQTETLGWLTIVLDARMLYQIVQSPEGLDATGEILLVGPATSNNKFETQIRGVQAQDAASREVKFVLPPQSNSTLDNRHDLRSWQSGQSNKPFLMGDYPVLVDAWTRNNHAINNAGSTISTHNEQNALVSAGYATLAIPLVDWALVFEQSHDEVHVPISHLRNIVIACVFGTTGALLLFMFPLAHYAVTPIRQLRAATKKTVEPYQPDSMSRQSELSTSNEIVRSGDEENIATSEKPKKGGFLAAISRWKGAVPGSRNSRPGNARRRTFRIPGKVPERKHFINDELTDLSSTFNEMSDELVMQYERLEERVAERTAELEKSKKAAEVANESKTLFIANISHELKTPLNGILGLCAVCMQEDDLRKVRSTLSTIYKSGDLLLHLLTDLLTFSKNSIGQQIQIDEAEFRLIDLKTQVVSIFEKQAREAQVELRVVFQGVADAYGDASDVVEHKSYGPSGTGRVQDMCLWGDKNRILQVLMNFTSNSLKFTPARGSVEVRVRCMGIEEDTRSIHRSTRNPSLQSKQSRSSKKRGRGSNRGSDTSLPRTQSTEANGDINQSLTTPVDPTLSINVAGTTKHIPQIAVRDRSSSPAPLNTKTLAFEFQVEDTGPGIPEDQQNKIFEPFVQGDLGLSKKYGGTGLGLSICAQLANLMGGGISLKSTVGVGSTFTMRLPLRYVTERAASIASTNPNRDSTANSIVGQPLHDEPRTPQRIDSMSDLSIHTTDGDVAPQDALADVPRIVGFTQPYLAKDQAWTESPQKGMKQLKKAESEAARTGQKVRVLVAEDNKVNQEVVLRMLRLEEVYGRYS